MEDARELVENVSSASISDGKKWEIGFSELLHLWSCSWWLKQQLCLFILLIIPVLVMITYKTFPEIVWVNM